MGSHLISPKWVIHKVQFRQKNLGCICLILSQRATSITLVVVYY